MSQGVSLSRFASRDDGPSEPSIPKPLRVGILGAAAITPMALSRPARRVPEVHLEAVAARDPERARRFAKKHGIARALDSYDALIEDPDVDAIYNPLPNSHHCAWTLRALEAGKHVLCEKPMAANADEALRMAEAAEKSGRVLMEAFHWRYHPLAERMKAIVTGGELGQVEHIETTLCIPLLAPGNIRYRLDLAGGATMDVGAYTVNILRFLAGAEPQVVRAEARLSSPGVDRSMRADFRFEDGRTGRMTCSLLSPRLFAMGARVRGDAAQMHVFNPIAPHIYHRLKIAGPNRSSVEHVRGEATYTHQLRAFAAAVTRGAPFPSNGIDGVANMAVIDAVYRAAGLAPRGT